MNAQLTTATGALARDLMSIRDVWDRGLALAAHIRMLGEAFDGEDQHGALMDLASDIEGTLMTDAEVVMSHGQQAHEDEWHRSDGYRRVIRMVDEANRKGILRINRENARLGLPLRSPIEPAALDAVEA